VGSSALSKKTHVVAVDPGQSVDLVFPVWCWPSLPTFHSQSSKKNKTTL
jgi:hypothetical protein